MAEQVAANADVVLEGSTPPAVPPTPVVDENGNVVATPPAETPVVETVTSTDLDAIISDDGSGAKPKDAKSRIQQLVAKSKKVHTRVIHKGLIIASSLGTKHGF